jgi:hypothetical protein
VTIQGPITPCVSNDLPSVPDAVLDLTSSHG